MLLLDSGQKIYIQRSCHSTPPLYLYYIIFLSGCQYQKLNKNKTVRMIPDGFIWSNVTHRLRRHDYELAAHYRGTPKAHLRAHWGTPDHPLHFVQGAVFDTRSILKFRKEKSRTDKSILLFSGLSDKLTN